MNAALAGVRVLDLSRLIPGPLASLILADLGAQVDKVEDPRGGDYLRHVEATAFAMLNRGKRSAAVDLKTAGGRAAFLTLVQHYDVLIDSFRPGVLQRLDLGYETLHARNPQLIICALTGYGQAGDLASRAGHDLNYMARSGLLSLQGPEAGPPTVPGFQVADTGGALYAVIAIVAALRERDKTGRGAVLDISMVEAARGFGAFAYVAAMGEGGSFLAGRGELAGGLAPYRTYRTKDGRAVALAALEPKFWSAFSRAVGLADDMQALVRGPHQAALEDTLAHLFAERTQGEWVAFANAHDFCLEPVLTPREALENAEAPHVFRTPVTTRGELCLAVPAMGEHTEAILREAGVAPELVDEVIGRRTEKAERTW